MNVVAWMYERDMRVEVSITELPSLGRPPYVIEPGEHVLVSFRDQVRDLVFREATEYSDARYVAELAVDGDVTPGDTLSVTLDRGADDTTTLVTAPATSFALDVPATPPANQDFVLTWSPTSPDPMMWAAQYCGSAFADGPIPVDTGSLTFPRGVLPVGTHCDIELLVRRTRKTRPDSAFSSSLIETTQIRRAVIGSTL